MEKTLKDIIALGENVNTELKEAKSNLPKNLFETVCSFLNTTGGYIILGVNDKKEIIGVDKEYVDKLKKEYATMCNNKNIIEPTIISALSEIIVEGKTLLYTYIDESDEIHKCKNKVYYRNYEGDFDITNNISLIANIHNHKRKIYDEDTIYPYISIEEDLKHELIDRARELANSNVNENKKHIWMEMTDLELLKSAGLYKKDKVTGKEGVTLAGVMLFGTDTAILSVNPYCRTDALLRVDDLDRYDDRDFVETNLLDTYDRLLAFIKKHTKDRFTLDDDVRRVSARNIMAKEVVINTLMHRNLTDGHTSRIIIYEDKMICENPNSFGTMGVITEKNVTPIAKNPTLAKFFREIGYADELGSGVKKITKYSYLYSGDYPIFEDKEMFKVTIPLKRIKNTFDIEDSSVNYPQIIRKSSAKDDVLEYIKKEGSATKADIMDNLGLSEGQVKYLLKNLKEHKYLESNGTGKNTYYTFAETADD